MQTEEIIRMAREAGSIDSEDVILTVYAAFAVHEREACAKVCDDIQEVWLGEPVNTRPGYYCAAAIRARGQ